MFWVDIFWWMPWKDGGIGGNGGGGELCVCKWCAALRKGLW